MPNAATNPEVLIRPLRPEDDAALAALITSCLAEHGAGGEGFVTADPEFATLSQVYSEPRTAYFAAFRDGTLLGGAGFAPLKGGAPNLCELQKMYLHPTARGLGLGQQLLKLCLVKARELRFRYMYLETLQSMQAARALYEKNGFRPIDTPLGMTGHFGCNAWYLLNLRQSGSRRS